jgi:hypothetical protein
VPEPTPATLTPIILAVTDPESKQHSASLWYQREGMEKPERSPFYGRLSPEGWPDRVIHPVSDPGMAVRMLQWIERSEYTLFPRIRFNKTDITMDDLRFLARWGCLPEENDHAVTVHYLDGPALPGVIFFDGAPQAAAQQARKWIADSGKEIRRIRFNDGDGGSIDTSIAGLENLARCDERCDEKGIIKGFLAFLYENDISLLIRDGIYHNAQGELGKKEAFALVESYLEERA